MKPFTTTFIGIPSGSFSNVTGLCCSALHFLRLLRHCSHTQQHPLKDIVDTPFEIGRLLRNVGATYFEEFRCSLHYIGDTSSECGSRKREQFRGVKQEEATPPLPHIITRWMANFARTEYDEAYPERIGSLKRHRRVTQSHGGRLNRCKSIRENLFCP